MDFLFTNKFDKGEKDIRFNKNPFNVIYKASNRGVLLPSFENFLFYQK